MKSQHVHSLRYAFGLLALGALALAPDVYATDSKIVPATVCQPWVHPDASAAEAQEIQNSIRYSVNGRVYNVNTRTRLTVVCPIIRDNTQSHLNHVRVYVADNFPGSGIDSQGVFACRVRSNGRYGNMEVDQELLSYQGDDDPLYFWDIDSADTDGSYTLTCQIPPKLNNLLSWIGSIVIEEP